MHKVKRNYDVFFAYIETTDVLSYSIGSVLIKLSENHSLGEVFTHQA